MHTIDISPLDSAPEGPLAAHEIARRDQLLSTVLGSDSVFATPARRSRARFWAIPVAAAVAIGGGAAAIGAVTYIAPRLVPAQAAASGPLSTAALASWTTRATALTTSSPAASAAENWCIDELTDADAAGAAPTFTNVNQRGDVVSLIVRRGGYTFLCTVGSDGKGFWETIDGPGTATPPSGQITLGTAGAHGNGAAAISYLEGRAATDVASITIHTATQTVEANVQDGIYTAWWPMSGDNADLDGTITVTSTNGATRTIDADTFGEQ